MLKTSKVLAYTTTAYKKRCHWCTEFTIAKARFCKYCGSELLDMEYFGAARILQHLGVHQLDIIAKIEKLPKAKLELYQQRYNQSFKIVKFGTAQIEALQPFLMLPVVNACIQLEKIQIGNLPFNERYIAEMEPLLQRGVLLADLLVPDPYVQNPLIRAYINAAHFRSYPSWPEQTGKIVVSNIYTNSVTLHELCFWFAHPNAFIEDSHWATLSEILEKKQEDVVPKIINILSSYLNNKNYKAYAALALVHILQVTHKQNHPNYNNWVGIAHKGLQAKNIELQLATAYFFKVEEQITSIALLDVPPATNAFLWLLEYKYTSAYNSIVDYGINVHQFKALHYAAFNKRYSKIIAEDIFIKAAIILKEAYDGDNLFFKPMVEINNSNILLYHQFIEKFKDEI